MTWFWLQSMGDNITGLESSKIMKIIFTKGRSGSNKPFYCLLGKINPNSTSIPRIGICTVIIIDNFWTKGDKNFTSYLLAQISWASFKVEQVVFLVISLFERYPYSISCHSNLKSSPLIVWDIFRQDCRHISH